MADLTPAWSPGRPPAPPSSATARRPCPIPALKACATWSSSLPAISITTACPTCASSPPTARPSIATSTASSASTPICLPARIRQAVWLDYDHDYDLDLFLIGDDSRLLRNNGEAGFSDETSRFPFVAGPRAERRAVRPRARHPRLRPGRLLPGPPGRPLSRPPRRGNTRQCDLKELPAALDASACQGPQPRWPHRSGGRSRRWCF